MSKDIEKDSMPFGKQEDHCYQTQWEKTQSKNGLKKGNFFLRVLSVHKCYLKFSYLPQENICYYPYFTKKLKLRSVKWLPKVMKAVSWRCRAQIPICWIFNYGLFPSHSGGRRDVHLGLGSVSNRTSAWPWAIHSVWFLLLCGWMSYFFQVFVLF